MIIYFINNIFGIYLSIIKSDKLKLWIAYKNYKPY